jgi:iron complex outermembrane receptor protein
MLFGLTKAYSQNYELKGILKDSVTNEVLAYATVYNITLSKGTQTIADGSFILETSNGKNLIKIDHIGCDTKFLTLNFSKNTDTVIYMAHHQHELEDVIIVAEKNKLIQLEKDRLKYDDIVISGSKPIASILDKMPGVSSLKTGFTIAKPMIQGMYGSRVIVLNNGLKQEGQQWGQEHGLEIDSYNTGQITLVKGAEALRYTGDAIGGILLIEPLYKATDTLKMSLTTAFTDNGRQGNLSVSAEKLLTKKLGLRLQGTYKKAGNLNTPNYYLPNTGFEELNGSLTMKWQPSKHSTFEVFSSIYNNKPGILSTSHIGNLTDLQKIINNETIPEMGSFTYTIARPYQQINHLLNKAKWKYEISPSLNIETVYGFQINKRKEFDSHNYFNKTAPSLDFTLHTHQLDFVINKTFKKGLFLKAGLNGYYQTNTYIGRFFIPNYKKSEVYQFALLRYKKNRHELELGYRAGAINLNAYKWVNNVIVHYPYSYNGISWQAGWLYKITTDWQVALQIGHVWRNPNISEQFSEGMHHGAAAIEYGNKNLKPENAVSINGTLKYRHNKTLFETEVFVKQVKNYIYLRPKFLPELTIRGAFPAFEYVQTHALFAGVDLLLNQQLPRNFSFIEKVSILNVYDQKYTTYINAIPPYRLNHSLVYKMGKFKWLSNSAVTFSVLQVLKQNRYTDGSDYMPPPKGYVLLNAAFTTNVSRNKNLLIFLSADNILNASYRDYMNRFRYYADETGRMISAGLNIKF